MTVTAGHVLPIAPAASGRFVDLDSKCNNLSDGLGGQTVFCNISAAWCSDHLFDFCDSSGESANRSFFADITHLWLLNCDAPIPTYSEDRPDGDLELTRLRPNGVADLDSLLKGYSYAFV